MKKWGPARWTQQWSWSWLGRPLRGFVRQAGHSPSRPKSTSISDSTPGRFSLSAERVGFCGLRLLWFGLFYLRLKFVLVFFTYGGKPVWSFLLTGPHVRKCFLHRNHRKIQIQNQRILRMTEQILGRPLSLLAPFCTCWVSEDFRASFAVPKKGRNHWDKRKHTLPCSSAELLLAPKKWEEAFLLTVGASLLTVKLLCLQSLKALTRRTFPL